ncbi:DNA helicase II [Anopheles sinensis]|uniref:DNA helicase II n=1 Tax=Anopheles sinensis TaxID=74873 RepID=A0A084W2T0_ANOSI|nr:DNA helicase II [Anopheles sinensis]
MASAIFSSRFASLLTRPGPTGTWSGPRSGPIDRRGLEDFLYGLARTGEHTHLPHRQLTRPRRVRRRPTIDRANVSGRYMAISERRKLFHAEPSRLMGS